MSICRRTTFIDDKRLSTTNVHRRRTFVDNKRSSTANVRRRRTFADDKRSSPTNVRHRQTFFHNERSSSKNARRRQTFVVDACSSATIGRRRLVVQIAIKLCSADPWTQTDLGPKTGLEHLGLNRCLSFPRKTIRHLQARRFVISKQDYSYGHTTTI